MTVAATPIRVQRSRMFKGSLLADEGGNGLPVRYCGRPGKFGNPYKYRTREALARVPAADLVTPWEHEGRCLADGAQHDMFWPGGEVSRHQVRYMTPAEIVATHRRALIAPTKGLRLWHRTSKGVTTVDVGLVRLELAGANLACWCPLGNPCHADPLLWVANAPEDEIKMAAEKEYAIIRESAERVAQLHPDILVSAPAGER